MPKTLRSSTETEAEPVKSSRFLVLLAPIRSEDEAKEILATEQRRYTDASHHCSAWRLATPVIERANDDGEPAGSAGRPMLAQLQGADLLDVVVVVTRYFGGTKLGVGGLVRAYGGAVGQAIGAAKALEVLTPHRILATVAMTYGHAFDSAILQTLARFAATTRSVQYEAEICRVVEIDVEDIALFVAATTDDCSGKVRLTDTDGSDLG